MSAEDTHRGADIAARVERRWATIAVIIIVMMAVLAAFAGIHRATMPQPRVETIDPSRLHLSGEFVESNLGSVLEANGAVTVRAIGQQYSFTPACILVPADTLAGLFGRHRWAADGDRHLGQVRQVQLGTQLRWRHTLSRVRRWPCSRSA